MYQEPILVFDFGSQFSQLITRRIRELGVYAILVHPDTSISKIKELNPKGIIFSGGPASVCDQGSPKCDSNILNLKIPILGICYGMQLLVNLLGGEIANVGEREYGSAKLNLINNNKLFRDIPNEIKVWMSHGDQIKNLPSIFQSIASSVSCPHAAISHLQKDIYGVQFHPEVSHTKNGTDIIKNFIFEICSCNKIWKMSDYRKESIEIIKNKVDKKGVICGLSGGVDSSVVAALLSEALGDQLTCIFVDNGLLRLNEKEFVEKTFRKEFSIDLRVIDAAELFLSDLKGVLDPQEKRRLIGHRFIDVFKSEAENIQSEKGITYEYLAQGTLYPDVIESGHGYAGNAANIKLHHNVGGLPEKLGFKLVEPLRELFKDEVRTLGQVLGLSTEIIWRHPFPGPGLAVRCLGEVTEKKLTILRHCDKILLEEIIKADLYKSTSQVFAVLLPVKSVGVMGDGRTYDQVIAIRSVDTQDFMTADWSRIPYDVLGIISNRIINEVRGVNRVVYDISSKPPATIEWE